MASTKKKKAYPGNMRSTFLMLFVLFSGLAIPLLSHAQQTTVQIDEERFTSGADALRASSREGGLGGPSSVGAQLSEDRSRRIDASRNPWLDAVFQPLEDSLANLRAETGLQLGFDYQATWQLSHDNTLGTVQASSGKARILGKWDLINRDTDNVGSLVFLFEKRHKLWNELTPGSFGWAGGYVGIPGLTFTDSGAHVSTVYWDQNLADGKAGLIAGRIDPGDFIDVLGYANPQTTFQNFSVLLNSSIAIPDPGFGLGFGGYVTDQIYALGLISDANGSLTDVKWFPGGQEYFSYGEIGWTPSSSERYLTNIHVGFWHVDERIQAGIPTSSGMVISANMTIDDVLMPFFRVGFSDGIAPLANKAVTGGFIYHFPQTKDLFGLAAAWNTPSSPRTSSQTALEAFYRYQISDNFAITADAQYFINPAANPSGDDAVVLGLRARFSL